MNPQNEYDRLLIFVFLGPYNAGKTSLFLRITKNTFLAKNHCTIGCDFATKTIEIDNLKIKAQIWDPVGVERFRSSAYYKGACEQSFQDAQKMYQETLPIIPIGVPVILVGCKSDLVEKRVVNQITAQTLASDLSMSYIETSAQENSNCLKALENLCRMGIPYLNQKIEQAQLKPKINDQKDHKNYVCF